MRAPSGFFETASFDLQWRDRAGFSPDFPIKPPRAPENIPELTHTGGRGQTRNAQIATARPETERPAAATRRDARLTSESSPAGGSAGSPSQTSVTSTPFAHIGPIKRRSMAPAVAAS